MVTRMREKGQITIPVEIREALGLDKDSVLSVVRIGEGILLTQGPSKVQAVSRKFKVAAAENGITLDDLLTDLRAERERTV